MYRHFWLSNVYHTRQCSVVLLRDQMWCYTYLHATVVNDDVLIFNFRIKSCNLSTALQK